MKKLLKIFKKGSKVAAKHKGKKGVKVSAWPPGTKIGLYGHANSGKTIYFTVLNEECKISRNLQISVTDNATAGEFLSNYRSLWGLGTAADAGTVVDLRGEKKFPDPTQNDRILLFNAIIDRKKKFSIVGYDYPGKSISISEQSEQADKAINFMYECDGILFLYDPKVMGAELESQAHVASFVNMVEGLASQRGRIPIPVALVITKSDILPGFSGDKEVVLIRPEDEYLVSEDFEFFLEKVLESNRIASNTAWAGSVRNVLVKLKDFLRVVLGRTLDFQVFFISATGETPEKIGTDIGRSLYTPPKKMQPVGVKEPFYWLLNAISRNKKISIFRTIAKYAALICLIWIILFSIPNLWHFKLLHPKPQKIEKEVKEAYGGNMYSASEKERERIVKAYNRYEHSFMVKSFFSDFLGPSQRIREAYRHYNQREAIKNLNEYIARFAVIVKDTTLWPRLNPSDSTVILNEGHEKLLSTLQNYHKGDETSILFTRSGRSLAHWEMFITAITNPSDTTIWKTIQEQVQTDQSLYASELSAEERQLGDALSERKVSKVKKEVAKKAAVELDDIIEKINGNDSPAYRLGDAVSELRKIRSSLDPGVDAKSISIIDRYLSQADKWARKRTYNYKVETVPSDGHLHIEVTEKGKDPKWAEESQILAGFEYKLQWKEGDVIHIAIDTLMQAEMWGSASSDRTILRDKYSIFNMDGSITFDNIGKKVEIRFIPPLIDQLPKLDK